MANRGDPEPVPRADAAGSPSRAAWAAKLGLNTAEGFSGPPAASDSSPPSAMAGTSLGELLQ